MFINEKGEKIIHLDHNISNSFLHVRHAGITYPNPNFLVTHNISSAHPYDFYVFEYVVTGRGYIESDGERESVRAGQVFFLNRSRRQIYYADRDEPFQKQFVAVGGELVDHLVEAYRLTQSVIVREFDARPLFDELFALLTEEPLDLDRTALILHQFILALSPQRDRPQNPRTLNTAEQIRRYLELNLYDPPSLETMAAYFHMSKSNLARIFKKQFGTTVIHYLMEQRIRTAAYLLENSSMKIYEVAEMLRYADSKTFTRAFTGHMGISPSQYRSQSMAKKRSSSARHEHPHPLPDEVE